MSREHSNHEQYAAQLRARVGDAGTSGAALRSGALERDSGGPPLPEPFDALVTQVGTDSARVTDRQVSRARAALGSDRAAFELILSAAIGAALRRWDAAQGAIGGDDDASA